VAQSLIHDLIPAKRVVLATAWIDRRHGQNGWGATAPPTELPRIDFTSPDMRGIGWWKVLW